MTVLPEDFSWIKTLSKTPLEPGHWPLDLHERPSCPNQGPGCGMIWKKARHQLKRRYKASEAPPSPELSTSQDTSMIEEYSVDFDRMNGTKTQPLRVAIVGAGTPRSEKRFDAGTDMQLPGIGVAGLTTAIGIQKAQKRGANVVFNVYEAAPEFKPIGAGLDLAFNSQRALRLVGAEKAFTSVMDVTDPHTW